MENFNGLGLPVDLAESLASMKFTNPTPIQAKAIPLALQGRDILGSAQTGTGKTGAFSIPLIAKLMQSSKGSAIILTPTRELAVQVEAAIRQMLGQKIKLRTALLIGGESMPKQFAQLRARPRIIVGTPGRVNDHLTRGTLQLHDAGFLVLDEMDRMLDMGFGIQIDAILKFMPKEKQTLLFSATIPNEILKIAGKYLNNPERVSVGEVSKPAVKIKQDIVNTTEENKYTDLVKELDSREGTVIIFAKTKRGTEKLSDKLVKKGYKADYIHGDLKQSRRDKVIRSYREGKFRILVATDVAARGLDVPHIKLVVNYDLPQCPEDYIHRIGRTARAGAEGSSLCLITSSDNGKWKDIQRLLNPDDPAFKDTRKGGSSKPSSRSSRGGRDRFFGGRRDNRSDSRGESKFFGGERSERRSEGRSEGRSENRNENSGERRSGGKFFGGKNENRDERRGESKFFGGERSERRSEGRSENGGAKSNGSKFFGGRNENRDERRGESKFFGGERSERRSEGRSEGRSENRNENSGERRSGSKFFGGRKSENGGENKGKRPFRAGFKKGNGKRFGGDKRSAA